MSRFVCVHIRQSHLCLSNVYLDLCCGVIVDACSLCVLLSMCMFVLCDVKYLLNAFAICVGEVTGFYLKVVVLLL